ncbi:MAG: tRNA (adenosine(37)-N6)-threonylcarbamoyltransferase complex dimerization subunit type 1 TsaB [Clostridiaceae bacterium]|jgi:tRNA threonylcarbamoyladenosine biosynthesis protein TsaB|nr:tRNA (adenosine(37)-N6)-threonylcarbamoyltransferase complex dimerization subunit type 1 TsaB [Clostridiaceae bacterium]
MRTLALETATMTASCAVAEDGRVIGELTTSHAKTHSQQLVPMIQSLLGLLGLKAEQIDLYAASIGPGSFTGLRIGIVTVKGMAYAQKKPVCGIPTLDALAYSVNDFNGVICPMMDARNNQVYTAVYRKKDGAFERVSDYHAIHISELAGILADFREEVLILGNGAPLHFAALRDAIKHTVWQADKALFLPRAACTALLAEKQARRGLLSSPFELEPLYLRKSQAERMKESKA